MTASAPKTVSTHTGLRWLLLAGAAALAFLLALASQVSTAHAHDQIVGNAPDTNEVLDSSPKRVDLHFNNAVLEMGEGATIVRLQDAEGHTIDVQAPEVDGRTVSVRLNDELADGAYRVVWRVVSSDGHPIEGTFAFAVGAGGQAALDAMPAVGEEHAHDHDHGDEEDSDSALSPVLVALIGAGVIAAAVVVVLTVFVRVRRGSGSQG